jgi:hypothetical protein
VSDHEAIRGHLASHLLGAASPAEAQELELHLVECDECRSELEELKPLLPLYQQARLAARVDFDPADWEQRLRTRLDVTLRRRRRHLELRASALLGFAAAVVAAVLLLPPLFQPTPTVAFRGVGDTSHATGTVVYQAKPWGTQLILRVAGLPQGQELVAYVEPLRGSWLDAGSWRTAGPGQEVVEVAASLPVGQIRGVVVETRGGQRLLAASSPAP